jgi:6-pyruvoyltetrahydropterin/6-carboxytetrahydropterin synthase
MRIELEKEFSLESAHRLPHVPADHKCARLHGHSFRVTGRVSGNVDPRLGWLIDYADISIAFAPLQDELDHRYLNEVPGIENPTSELLARFIFDRLKPTLPQVSAIVVAETCSSRCVYTGTEI